MGKALFITGTGTDIGKTYVTGLIVKKLVDSGRQASYYKAALSGAEPGPDGRLQPGDALFVKEMAKLPAPVEKLVSYVYREAVSPHLAAKINAQPIDFDRVKRDFAAARAASFRSGRFRARAMLARSRPILSPQSWVTPSYS